MEFQFENGRFFADASFGKLVISSKDEWGFRPYELFVSAIAGCSGEMLIHLLRKKRMSFDELTIQPNVTREGIAQKIKSIHLHFVIQNIDVTADKLEKIVNLAMKHCSMAQTVKGSLELTASFQTI
ncbi:OsmC family protein [Bacillus sp. NPDC077027]|uniref:OsmC family protein n=1 Tax=Bacillus sp. NPDC077027 TaxID=3390548 RepID=UPI003D070262